MIQHHSNTLSTSGDIRDTRKGRDVCDVVARVLSWTGTALTSTAAQYRQQADHYDSTDVDEGALERETRAAHRRVTGLSTGLEDVSEVEYRRIRLEKVVLVSLKLPCPHGAVALGDGVLEACGVQDANTSLHELAALVETARSQVLGAPIQRRGHPDLTTYLGGGRTRELAGVVAATGADAVIVDGKLAPSQRRTLKNVVGVKVVDRTALILDIFAQHAKPRKGKTQVELAQLEYLLPHLHGWSESMSRQAGGRVASGQGIGSHDPGETEIELDRRRIRQHMARLRHEIQTMAPSRRTKHGSRRRGAIPSVTITDYTNAGKFSLMNHLTEADIMVESALSTALDPTVRRAETSGGHAYTLTDTVGFTRDLPHELIEAFCPTLEGVAGAGLVLHVVNAAHPDPLSQAAMVRTVLSEIPGALDVSEFIVLNKVDLADVVTLVMLRIRLPSTVAVSARTGEGVEELRARIEQMLPHLQVSIGIVVPYSHGSLVSRVHAEGEVDTVDYVETGTHVVVRTGAALAAEIEGAATSTSTGQRP